MWLYRFPELLRQLDDSKQRLGVASYGLAVTTLEEVFLKVSLQQGGSDSGSIQEVGDVSLPPFFTLLLCSLAQTRATSKLMSSAEAMILLPLVTGSCLVCCLFELPRPMQRIATPDTRTLHTHH